MHERIDKAKKMKKYQEKSKRLTTMIMSKRWEIFRQNREIKRLEMEKLDSEMRRRVIWVT